MYEELINKLRELPHLLFVQLGEHEDVVYQAADAIEELSRLHEAQRQNLITLMNEDPEMEWIPVTERLPEIGEKVLVFAYSNDTFTARMCEQTENGYPVFECDGIFLETAKPGRITHWVQISEPPKEGE